MRASPLILCVMLSVFIVAPGMANDTAPGMDHAAMGHSAAIFNPYAAAMDKMHKDMMVEPTGDPDVDFVRGMIPHHQGAIDMARVVLEKGKDPEIKKLAEGVVAAQEKEITMMQEWLKAHGK